MCRSVRIGLRAARQAITPATDVPAFLCPGIVRNLCTAPAQRPPDQQLWFSPRCFSSSATPDPQDGHAVFEVELLDRLPQQCPGCGALSQTVNRSGPGYYDLNKNAVKKFLRTASQLGLSDEDEVVGAGLARAASLGITTGLKTPAKVSSVEPPVCNRCHNLMHHHTGVSIAHPSIQAIQDTIFETPYKYNHVYHILDAADFPMSLIPALHRMLHTTPLRSRNRRSKSGKFYHGKKTEVSFVITRSDLLAPTKQQVDSMMPYLRETIRDALGRTAKEARLGNLSCVSAKRGWWTKELKEKIWHHGGAGWMVGKVNVGKSQLLHHIFPKGRRDTAKFGTVETKPKPIPVTGQRSMRQQYMDVEKEHIHTKPNNAASIRQALIDLEEEQMIQREKNEIYLGEVGRVGEEIKKSPIDDPVDAISILPPAPAEVDYPPMPVVSDLPGTTASPIRLPFGNGRGELIDLPGLSRDDLEKYVIPEHRPQLVMRSRITPEQQVIKPGQSLLLGGIIRITPRSTDIVILAYAFTPITAHLTSTSKAIGTQIQTRVSHVPNIALPGTGATIASAGCFPLKWDVTRQRAGPVTASVEPARLPYRILATDILIEGCGWVELVTQISRHHSTLPPKSDAHGDATWPTVEVFSPEGRFIAARRPLNAWCHVARKPHLTRCSARPRKSAAGAKKSLRQRLRLGSA